MLIFFFNITIIIKINAENEQGSQTIGQNSNLVMQTGYDTDNTYVTHDTGLLTMGRDEEAIMTRDYRPSACICGHEEPAQTRHGRPRVTMRQ